MGWWVDDYSVWNQDLFLLIDDGVFLVLEEE